MILVMIRCSHCRTVLRAVERMAELDGDELSVRSCRRCWVPEVGASREPFAALARRARNQGLDAPPLYIGVPTADLRVLAVSAWQDGKTADYALKFKP